MKASEMIEQIGPKVVWQIWVHVDESLWYVNASHEGIDDETSFEFEEAGRSLNYVTRVVANKVLQWRKNRG